MLRGPTADEWFGQGVCQNSTRAPCTREILQAEEAIAAVDKWLSTGFTEGYEQYKASGNPCLRQDPWAGAAAPVPAYKGMRRRQLGSLDQHGQCQGSTSLVLWSCGR